MKNKLPSAVEMPIELWVNNNKIITFMGSPYDLEDLAVGHLITRGTINDISSIKNIEIKIDTYQIFVTTYGPISKEIYSVPEFVVSGTSSVSEFSDNIYRIPTITNDFSIELEKIVKFANIMVDEAIIYKDTGGVHSAILVTEDKYYLREDIGRHSAVDKAIGAALRDGKDLSNSFISTTGRISLDMLLKSAAVQIPIVTSLKYPSNMGIKLANHYNIAIVSRVLSKEPLVYSNENRIIK